MSTLKFNPVNIEQVLVEKKLPTIVMWNRLEGRPRTHHFDRALKAEVRDALWMIGKQWQMGEFKADDAGSPVYAKVHITSSHLDRYKAANGSEKDFENNIPLEAKAEQKKIPFTRNNNEISIDIRLQMGRYWLQLLKQEGLDFRSEYIKEYTFELPDKAPDTDHIYAHKDVWQQYAAISGRCLDGYKLFEHLSEGNHVADNITDTASERDDLESLAGKFTDWFSSMYYQPSDEKDHAWLPDRLEYQFKCSAKSDVDTKTLEAEEYYHGHLDWYAFDIKEESGETGSPSKKTFTDSFIPSHVEFDGMPDTRWWKFEDGMTSLGVIKPSTTDLSKLLLMEFGLVFANDWFLIPYPLPIGSLANVEGLTVKNNFGETIWIKSTEEENTKDTSWSMFKMKSESQNNTLFLAPAVMKTHEGNPLEEILLIRDEMSNMVWGIETTIPTPTGKGDKGNEAALRIRKYHEKLIGSVVVSADVPYAAPISYLAMTQVPENWIPFVPVHKENDNREIQLQRASMLRIIEGDPSDRPEKIKPKTSILREGLDEKPDPLAYYLHEEEIPRAGVKVSQAFQRARWLNGEVFTWLGMKKKTGRGEGSSGLAFDKIKNV
jgi:hypothetical protein